MGPGYRSRAKSTTSMARSTPAQNPRGLASKILVGFIELSSPTQIRFRCTRVAQTSLFDVCDSEIASRGHAKPACLRHPTSLLLCNGLVQIQQDVRHHGPCGE